MASTDKGEWLIKKRSFPETVSCNKIINLLRGCSATTPLHPADLITEYPLDFVAHGFPAGGAEMDFHPVGGLADFLHKCGTLVLLYDVRNNVVKHGSVVGDISVVHERSF
mgnify:CR=1 FL=1